MTYEFHFKINEKTLEKLKILARKLEMSLSKTIIFIFMSMHIFIERNHLMTKEKDSKYKIIADFEEERYSVHSYIELEIYKKLKHIHQDLNFYSMAQILREVIERFLEGCEKYGIFEFIKRLKKINEIWEEKKIIHKKNKKYFVRQLKGKKSRIPYCETVYNSNSSTKQILLL